MTKDAPETIDEVVDVIIDAVLDDEVIDKTPDSGVFVEYPKRPVPEELYFEVNSIIQAGNGQKLNEQRLSFDGYVLTWRAVPYPHIPSLKSYHILVERDGQVFYEREHKMYLYEKRLDEIVELKHETQESKEDSTKPLPEKIFVEMRSMFPERSGRQAGGLTVQFDGYRAYWLPAASPHKTSVKSYLLSISRDNVPFFVVEHKIFSY